MKTHESDKPASSPETMETLALIKAFEADGELRDFLDPGSREFLADCDFDEALGCVYGLLLDHGYDPDSCLQRIGILEPDA